MWRMAWVLSDFLLYLVIWVSQLQFDNAVTVSGTVGFNALMAGNFTNETSITIESTNLTTVDKILTSKIPNVEELTFKENADLVNISDDALKDLQNLAKLKVEKSPLERFPNVSGVESLLSIILKYTSISEIDPSCLTPYITHFSIANNRRTEAIPLMRYLPNLHYLNLNNNSITANLSEVLKGCHSVREFSLGFNGFNAFPDLENCAGKVRKIDLTSNNIKVITEEQLVNLTSLTHLILNKNPLISLPELPASALLKLDILNVSYLKHEQSHDGEMLNMLSASTVCADNSSFNTYPNISDETTKVTLVNNSIQLIHVSSFSGESSLQDLDLSKNQLTIFPPIALLRNLTRLVLDRNIIQNITWTDVNPMNFVIETLSLTDLHLAGNNITELDIEVLARLKSLERLDMSNNVLTSVPAAPIKDMTNLTYLLLNGNRLQTLGDILNLNRLSLDIQDNEIVCDVRLCWMKETLALNLKIDHKPCTAPPSLMTANFNDMPSTRMLCHLQTVSELSPPFDVYVKTCEHNNSNRYERLSATGYQDMLVMGVEQKLIPSCCLECMKHGSACPGFIYKDNICFLMVDGSDIWYV